MDNQESNDYIDENDAGASELIRAQDALPTTIPVLPQTERPFFPGQVIPLLIDPDTWEATVRLAQENSNGVIGLLLANTERAEQATIKDFYKMGTVARIHRIGRVDGRLQVLLEGVQRFRVTEWIGKEIPFTAQVRYFPEPAYDEDPETKAYAIAIINTIKELVPLNPLYGEEFKLFLDNFHPNDPSHLADFAASLTTSARHEQQEVLEAVDLLERLQRVHALLIKELEVAKTQAQIRKQVEEDMQEHQREHILREQMKVIQKELGISKDDRTAEVDKFRERLAALTLSEAAEKRIKEEMDKFAVLETGSPEYATTRNYLDWLTSLPWGVHTKDQLDLTEARRILDEDHDGLEDIKQRIMEFIGVGIMKGEVSGSIILFVGPPGVGKTSLGRSIARALGRRFFRFSLGGMRDEAEIKGHRRTYIGAMPGKFIQAIKDTQSANPVIMLDEIDKVGASYQGDPASALLEVLDPEQNSDFLDHYLDVSFDLSKTLFICTANQLDTIPGPLLDRMEIIQLSGYLASEKMDIARHHLLPRQLERNGLKSRGQLRIDKAALRKIVEDYAREAGVRRLEKYLGKIARKAVVKILEGEKTPIHVRAKDVEDYLGKPIFSREKPMSGVGIITGLAWTAMGGATLSIEATRIHSFTRGFKLTGQLGDVMRESAEIAYSHILANAERWGASADFFEKSLIHLHVPAGATPKDGPSAGITMACALLSLAMNRRPRRNLAMTGELTLTGQVLPVGGIREKVIAARRVNIRELILPAANRGDFEEIPEHIREGIKVNFAEKFDDVVAIVFNR
ncbi:ATP dependent PIM1 peptidase [Thiogranum longum]|uniref:Lon protease n=1 Tax=Thiogranum longum TaxID=1537524 RepID=A0A4R1H9G2_9GAMM|nr:endopeptidase La [Thiogranum longum]TCK17928.1 ATP dependent PIM1 peptidase [Thiogranum longum]